MNLGCIGHLHCDLQPEAAQATSFPTSNAVPDWIPKIDCLIKGVIALVEECLNKFAWVRKLLIAVFVFASLSHGNNLPRSANSALWKCRSFLLRPICSDLSDLTHSCHLVDFFTLARALKLKKWVDRPWVQWTCWCVECAGYACSGPAPHLHWFDCDGVTALSA